MKIEVDKDTCIGCEVCVGVCPDVFYMDDDGKSAVKNDVSESDKAGAEEAAQSCPVYAITVE